MDIKKCDYCKVREYDRGSHGMLNGEAHSDYWCEECWQSLRKEKYGNIKNKKADKDVS